VSLVPRPCVCLVTDRRQLAPDARTASEALAIFERWLEEAIGCVDLIQIRERDLEAAQLFDLSRRVAARAAGSGTSVIVNDRADVAAAAGAAGVHLRSDGPPVERVRAWMPPGALIGHSVHDDAGILASAAADYWIFGTIFPSRSKPAGSPVQGVAALREATRRAAGPVLAIGGIDPARAAACWRAGAAGVAAITPFLPPGRAPGAMGIQAAVDAFRAAMR
jgi:thiamine-phosphate diphosphorylase